jgi:hypothetical protein
MVLLAGRASKYARVLAASPLFVGRLIWAENSTLLARARSSRLSVWKPMAGPEQRKVVVRTPDGTYLSRGENGLRFVNDIYGAVLFEPKEDQMEELLLALQSLTGLVFEVVPLVVEEVFEPCDQCSRSFIPLQMFFDGQSFLCPECRKRRAKKG